MSQKATNRKQRTGQVPLDDPAIDVTNVTRSTVTHLLSPRRRFPSRATLVVIYAARASSRRSGGWCGRGPAGGRATRHPGRSGSGQRHCRRARGGSLPNAGKLMPLSPRVRPDASGNPAGGDTPRRRRRPMGPARSPGTRWSPAFVRLAAAVAPIGARGRLRSRQHRFGAGNDSRPHKNTEPTRGHGYTG